MDFCIPKLQSSLNLECFGSSAAWKSSARTVTSCTGVTDTGFMNLFINAKISSYLSVFLLVRCWSLKEQCHEKISDFWLISIQDFHNPCPYLGNIFLCYWFIQSFSKINWRRHNEDYRRQYDIIFIRINSNYLF